MMKIPTTTNELYPVFLRLDRLQVIIIGAGNVGAEKLRFLLKSSPNANVTVVAKTVNHEVGQLLESHPTVVLHLRPYSFLDLNDSDVVIAATEDPELNYQIWDQAKRQKLLVNVADTPELCDFYLGGIVTRGNLKVAISTNGQSPTLAKRMRQLLEEILPEETSELVINLNRYRNRLKGDFEERVSRLNALTRGFLENE